MPGKNIYQVKLTPFFETDKIIKIIVISIIDTMDDTSYPTVPLDTIRDSVSDKT